MQKQNRKFAGTARVRRTMKTTDAPKIEQKRPGCRVRLIGKRMGNRSFVSTGAFFPAVIRLMKRRLQTRDLRNGTLMLSGRKKMMVRTAVKRAQHRAGQQNSTQHDPQKNGIHFYLAFLRSPLLKHTDGIQKPSAFHYTLHFNKISLFRKWEE